MDAKVVLLLCVSIVSCLSSMEHFNDSPHSKSLDDSSRKIKRKRSNGWQRPKSCSFGRKQEKADIIAIVSDQCMSYESKTKLLIISLQNRNTNLNATDEWGNTALHLLAKSYNRINLSEPEENMRYRNEYIKQCIVCMLHNPRVATTAKNSEDMTAYDILKNKSRYLFDDVSESQLKSLLDNFSIHMRLKKEHNKQIIL